MQRIKKIILMTIATAIFLIFPATVSLSVAFADEIMLFVGDGCPHCAIVEEYLEKNNVYSKLPITIYEVWHNDENARLYTQKAAEVGYTNGYVPLLIDGEKYVDGDKPIIKYIDELLAAQTSTNEPAITSISDTAPSTTQEEPAKELAPSILAPDDQNTLKNMLADPDKTTQPINFPLIIGAVIILVVGLIFAKTAGRGR